jgi:hypothetical protein
MEFSFFLESISCSSLLFPSFLSPSLCTDGHVRGYCMFFSKDGCKIFDQKGCKVIGKQVATAKEVKGVYELEVDSPQHDQQKCFVTENTHPDKNVQNSQELRHRRSAHLNTGDAEVQTEKTVVYIFQEPKTPLTMNVPKRENNKKSFSCQFITCNSTDWR